MSIIDIFFWSTRAPPMHQKWRGPSGTSNIQKVSLNLTGRFLRQNIPPSLFCHAGDVETRRKHTKKWRSATKSLNCRVSLYPLFGVFIFIVTPLFRAFKVWALRYLPGRLPVFLFFKCSILNIALFLLKWWNLVVEDYKNSWIQQKSPFIIPPTW